MLRIDELYILCLVPSTVLSGSALIPVSKETERAIVIAVSIIIVVTIILMCCWFFVNAWRKAGDSSQSIEAANDTRMEPARSVSSAQQPAPAAGVSSSAQVSEDPAIFSTDILSKIAIPYMISEDEEITLYQQNMQWLLESDREGASAWAIRMYRETRVDLQKRKNLSMFRSCYTHILGSRNSCNSCRAKVQQHEMWYRCRQCVDVDFCITCFGYGPSLPSYGHVPSHEMAKMLKAEQCEGCEGLSINTRLSCDNCDNIFYCLGCYKEKRHSRLHSGHIFTRLQAKSYVMLKACDTRTETTPLLPPYTEPRVPSLEEEVPPPSYEECIHVVKGSDRI